MNQGMKVNLNKANYMERVPNTSLMAIGISVNGKMIFNMDQEYCIT